MSPDDSERPKGDRTPAALDSVIERSEVSITPSEHEDDRRIRNLRENNAAQREHLQSNVIFFLVVAGIALFVMMCSYIIVFDDAASQKTKQWAKTGLTSVVSASLAFLFGRAVGAK